LTTCLVIGSSKKNPFTNIVLEDDGPQVTSSELLEVMNKLGTELKQVAHDDGKGLGGNKGYIMALLNNVFNLFGTGDDVDFPGLSTSLCMKDVSMLHQACDDDHECVFKTECNGQGFCEKTHPEPTCQLKYCKNGQVLNEYCCECSANTLFLRNDNYLEVKLVSNVNDICIAGLTSNDSLTGGLLTETIIIYYNDGTNTKTVRFDEGTGDYEFWGGGLNVDENFTKILHNYGNSYFQFALPLSDDKPNIYWACGPKNSDGQLDIGSQTAGILAGPTVSLHPYHSGDFIKLASRASRVVLDIIFVVLRQCFGDKDTEFKYPTFTLIEACSCCFSSMFTAFLTITHPHTPDVCGPLLGVRSKHDKDCLEGYYEITTHEQCMQVAMVTSQRACFCNTIPEVCVAESGLLWADGTHFGECTNTNDAYKSSTCTCEPCGNGSSSNNDGMTCTCTDTTQVWNSATNQCKPCGNGSSPAGDGMTCTCDDGVRDWNSDNNRCECLDGQGWIDDNRCEPCGNDSSSNNDGLNCKCTFLDLYWNSATNQCETCGHYSGPAGDGLTCNCPSFLDWDSETNQCLCPVTEWSDWVDFCSCSGPGVQRRTRDVGKINGEFISTNGIVCQPLTDEKCCETTDCPACTSNADCAAAFGETCVNQVCGIAQCTSDMDCDGGICEKNDHSGFCTGGVDCHCVALNPKKECPCGSDETCVNIDNKLDSDDACTTNNTASLNCYCALIVSRTCSVYVGTNDPNNCPGNVAIQNSESICTGEAECQSLCCTIPTNCADIECPGDTTELGSLPSSCSDVHDCVTQCCTSPLTCDDHICAFGSLKNNSIGNTPCDNTSIDCETTCCQNLAGNGDKEDTFCEVLSGNFVDHVKWKKTPKNVLLCVSLCDKVEPKLRKYGPIVVEGYYNTHEYKSCTDCRHFDQSCGDPTRKKTCQWLKEVLFVDGQGTGDDILHCAPVCDNIGDVCDLVDENNNYHVCQKRTKWELNTMNQNPACTPVSDPADLIKIQDGIKVPICEYEGQPCPIDERFFAKACKKVMGVFKCVANNTCPNTAECVDFRPCDLSNLCENETIECSSL